MSLKDAVLSIADDLEEKLTAFHDGETDTIEWEFEFRCLVRELRSAVKASVSDPVAMPIPAEVQHHIEIERARAEFRGNVPKIGEIEKKEEQSEPEMMAIIGGPNDNDLIAVPPGGKEGDKTAIDGNVYNITKGRKLRFNPVETEALKKANANKLIIVGGQE